MARKRGNCSQWVLSMTGRAGRRRPRRQGYSLDHSRLGCKVQRFRPGRLRDSKAPDRSPSLSEEHRKALAAMIESGPIPVVHGVVLVAAASFAATIALVGAASATLGQNTLTSAARQLIVISLPGSGMIQPAPGATRTESVAPQPVATEICVYSPR